MVSSVPLEAAGEHQGNDFLVSLPATDLTLVVSLILGLLVLLLTCDSITNEKEEGTLKAVLATGVSRPRVLAGKLIGNLLAIGIPLGGSLSVSVAICCLAAGRPLTAEQWLRVAGLAAAYVAYLSLMLLYGLLISLYASSSSRPSSCR